MRYRNIKAYELVCYENEITKGKYAKSNEKLISIIQRRAKVEPGGWVWVYVHKSTISGGGKHVIKEPKAGSDIKSFASVPKLAIC